MTKYLKYAIIAPILLVLFMTAVVPPTLFAQIPTTTGIARPQAARYFLGNESEILMQINVWGFVRQPGQYMVPYDTDLIALLSYAGGPQEQAKVKNIKIIRKNAEDEKKRVITINVKQFMETGDPELVPVLKPGDTVIVAGTTFHFISTFFEFVWRIALIIQVVFLVDYYSSRTR
jgi:hypothetical protein